MKNVSKVRLSLRKLVVAAMAIGPIAVLPAPVWAALPTNSSFTVTNGTATVVEITGVVANINATDRAVLVWNDNAFNIAAGDTWNYNLPAGGAVLNKVGYNAIGTLAAADDAIIDGTLISSGRVFILANGNISVGASSVINTTGGLVLSTLQDSEASFITTGNLLNTGAALGNITLSDTLNVTGDLAAYTGSFNDGITIGAVGGGAIAGNVILRTVTTGASVALATGSALAVTGGNLSVTTVNGAITQAAAITTASNRTSTFNTGSTGASGVTLSDVANNFGTVAVTTNGAVALVDADAVVLGASTIGGALSVTAGGNITSSGAVAVTGAADLVATAGLINIGNSSSVGGTLTGSTVNGNFTYSGTGNVTAGAISTGTGAIALTGTNNVTLGGVLTSTGNISATGVRVTQSAGATISGANVVTFNATGGNATLGPISATRVAITSNNGTIGQTAATAVVTTATTGVNSFNAGSAGTVTLNLANDLNVGPSLNVTAASANIVTGNSVNLNTVNTGGNLILSTGGSAGSVVLGGTGVGASAGTITVGGLMNITTTGAGTITDNDYSTFNVLGNVNLSTGSGVITLDAATANGALAPAVSLGAVNASTTGAVTLQETTTLNLGNVTGASLAARSTTGDIIDSGNLTLTTAEFRVGAAGNVTLDGANNVIDTVNFIGGANNSYLSNATSVTLGSTTVVAGSLTLSSSANKNIVVSGPQVTGSLIIDSGGTIDIGAATTVTGDLSLTSDATGAGSITQTGGALTVTGATSVTSAGNVALSGANDFVSVTLATTGDTAVTDKNNLTVSGSVGGVLTAAAGVDTAVVNAYRLTVGDLHTGGLALSAANGTGTPGDGASGSISQAAGTRLSSINAASFATNNAAITINNAGNNFGGVSLTSGTGAINLQEDQTLRLVSLSSTGNATLTSQFGTITQTASGAIGGNVLTLNAPNGSVLLSPVGAVAASYTSNTIIANAPNGAVSVRSNAGNLALGSINALSVNVTHTGSGNLTQSGAASIYGSSNFTSGGNIILSNTSNNFGRVALETTATKNVTIVEANTLNLGRVVMAGVTGNFTATSVNGGIIDSGLTGVNVTANRAVLTASNGNISLDDPTTSLAATGGIQFTGNDVVFSTLNSLNLGVSGTTSTANNLTVTSATGTITDSGNMTVTGDARFLTGNQNIIVDSTGNQFGSVYFSGAAVTIAQSNDINLITGSTATGAASFTSSGSYITIDSRGGIVEIAGTALFNAAGDILLPKLIQVGGTVTVISPNTKDLSALSLAGDLGGNTPVNLGTGTYVPPQP